MEVVELYKVYVVGLSSWDVGSMPTSEKGRIEGLQGASKTGIILVESVEGGATTACCYIGEGGLFRNAAAHKNSHPKAGSHIFNTSFVLNMRVTVDAEFCRRAKGSGKGIVVVRGGFDSGSMRPPHCNLPRMWH